MIKFNDGMKYRKTEGTLYNHYRKIKKINRLEHEIDTVQQGIDRIQKELKSVNVDLKDCVQGIDYSRDKIQSNNPLSQIETELIRITDRLLNELKYKIQKKYKTKSRLRNMQEDVMRVEKILEELNEEELQIVELKYGDNRTIRDIEKILDLKGMPLSTASIWRKKDKIIEFVCSQLEC